MVTLGMLVLVLNGCATLGYYGQAVKGQLSLLNQRRPIEQVLAQDHLSDALRAQLSAVLEIRRFAEHDLSLPVGESYSSYVDLQRQTEEDNYVVWNVFAAPTLSVEALTWCYPLLGCAEYRGYFSRHAALDYNLRFRLFWQSSR